eukprot:8002138-Lingulodinium_polyedra.AAC.1
MPRSLFSGNEMYQGQCKNSKVWPNCSKALHMYPQTCTSNLNTIPRTTHLVWTLVNLTFNSCMSTNCCSLRVSSETDDSLVKHKQGMHIHTLHKRTPSPGWLLIAKQRYGCPLRLMCKQRQPGVHPTASNIGAT